VHQDQRVTVLRGGEEALHRLAAVFRHVDLGACRAQNLQGNLLIDEIIFYQQQFFTFQIGIS
ncbi:MAG: hypothetical protein II879_07150, partial [Clostridia bacterium]|nr:hypothetical protein [Clostridia bacterium]